MLFWDINLYLRFTKKGIVNTAWLSPLHQNNKVLPNYILNPDCAKIISHFNIAGEGGGGHKGPSPPLSLVKAVIKEQTKKQMNKFWKITNYEQFYNGFYHNFTLKPLKTIIHINTFGRWIFNSINLKEGMEPGTIMFHREEFFLYRFWLYKDL